MSNSALEAYLAGIDKAAIPLVVALDNAIRRAYSDFDVAIKYRILMYALGEDWRHWVCSINVTKRSVVVGFLYGVLLDDPRGVLRSGTSVLKSWDFAFDDKVDTAAVRAYVTEAVGKYADYKANEQQILTDARAAAAARKPKSAR